MRITKKDIPCVKKNTIFNTMDEVYEYDKLRRERKEASKKQKTQQTRILDDLDIEDYEKKAIGNGFYGGDFDNTPLNIFKQENAIINKQYEEVVNSDMSKDAKTKELLEIERSFTWFQP